MSLISGFLAHAPDGTARVLAALARAESLTDKVASEIYERVPIPGLDAAGFVAVFKYSGLTEPRNSEWNLIPSVREELIERAKLARGAEISIHEYLLSLGQVEENRAKAGSEIPSYLFTEAGKAYHLAGAGKIADALQHYSNASRGPFNGAQWLAAKLATEQEKTKVIPEGEVETTFLRAWVMMREGKKRDAMPLFRKVAATDRVMREVAISLHMLGNENNRGQRREAEREFLRSIEIRRQIGDRLGIAHSLHSLANLLSIQEDRLMDAERAYRESINVGREVGSDFHVSQTLHSLANLLSRLEGRLKEAEEALDESIKLDKKLGDEHGLAQTLHSLANLLSRQEGRLQEAEDALDESIKLLKKLGDEHGLAQTLHSLANLLSRLEGRLKEAEEALKESVDLRGKVGDEFGLAQTLHSLANLLRRQEGRFEEAEKAYRESLRLGEKLKNDNHLAQVLRSYGLAIAERNPVEALRLLQRSLDINQRRGNTRFVRTLERDIRDLTARSKTKGQFGAEGGEGQA